MGHFLHQITARNLLSFGPEGMTLELGPLNVLIGPNGSGKSNLLAAISLLQAAPQELARPAREGGGVRSWIWQGQPETPACIEALSESDGKNRTERLRHSIKFAAAGRRFSLVDERVENERPAAGADDVYFYYRYQDGNPAINIRDENGAGGRRLKQDDFADDESVLSQLNYPELLPELAYLNRAYRSIRLYREWEFGRRAAVRQWQRNDVRPRPLREDFANLGMFLNRLRQYPRVKAALFEKLGDLYDGVTDFELDFTVDAVQISFTEGDFAIPAARLSDGSLRYLCLLAILLDPEPPRLIGIEEPELGIHPDLIPGLSDLLVDASSRCQLVVTTHSDILVDALTERLESVVVCDKYAGQTTMERLDRANLAHWLKKYRLGQLWVSGELGGKRW